MKLKDVKNVGCKCVILESNDDALDLNDIKKYLDHEISMDGASCVIIHDMTIEQSIKNYNDRLYDQGGYNKDMISTNKDFIDLYQNFLDIDIEYIGDESKENLESKIKEVKDSKELYVIDCLVLNYSINKFSTIKELYELMKDFDI